MSVLSVDNGYITRGWLLILPKRLAVVLFVHPTGTVYIQVPW
jgi:hypothetical protein